MFVLCSKKVYSNCRLSASNVFGDSTILCYFDIWFIHFLIHPWTAIEKKGTRAIIKNCGIDTENVFCYMHIVPLLHCGNKECKSMVKWYINGGSSTNIGHALDTKTFYVKRNKCTIFYFLIAAFSTIWHSTIIAIIALQDKFYHLQFSGYRESLNGLLCRVKVLNLCAASTVTVIFLVF